MINIIEKNTRIKYSFDEESGLIYKNGELISPTLAEPVFSNPGDEFETPEFMGILFKDIMAILSLNGVTNPITLDKNSIV